MKQWTNIDAGPRMVKATREALSKLQWEGKTRVELSGVIGQAEGPYDRSTITEPFATSLREDVTDALERIGERYGWQVTAKNYRQIIADVAEALTEAKANRPVSDIRRTPEADAERNAAVMAREAEIRAEQEKRNAGRAAALAKRPTGAHAVILAELKEDCSDSMTDYFANRTVRTVAIGWRFGSREDFRQLRAAAGSFPETVHLGPDASDDIEHRDNYSMGHGNYLSDHGWDGSGSGWIIRSADADATYWHADEIHLPEPTSAAAAVTSGEGVTVRPSSIGRDGVVEVVFDAKPDPAVIADLKAHGFRWARSNGCWYGRDTSFAQALAGAR